MNASNQQQCAPQIQNTQESVLERRFIEADDWDAIAVQFRDVIHEQTQCFNTLRWDEERLERVAFYKDGVLVSGAVVLVVRFPVVKTGVAVVKWGPLWRKNRSADDPMILLQTIAGLRMYYAEKRGLFLSFFPRADAEISPLEEEAFRHCGFYQGELLDSPERYFVNTGLPLDDIRASLGQKWRYNLKKAEKNDLTVRTMEGAEGARAFMALYQEMLARKSFHDTSAIGTLEHLMKADLKALRPLILFVENDGEPVAAAVVDTSGERAVYLYGATRDNALPLKAGYVMHWEVVKRLAADPDNKWYDLGGADAECDLHQFKRGFVGKKGVVSLTPRYYHFAATKQAYLFGELLYLARRTKGRIARRIHALMHG